MSFWSITPGPGWLRLNSSTRNELYTDIRLNDTLCDRYQTHMKGYSRDVIKNIDKVMTGSTDAGMSFSSLSLECRSSCTGASSNTSINTFPPAGNVSYVVPTLHTMFAIPGPDGAYPHHPSFAAAAGTDEAHGEAVIVGKVLALIGWDMLANDALFATTKQEWEADIAQVGGLAANSC